MFEKEDGLQKPSEILADRSWKKLQRRSYIRKLKGQTQSFAWKPDDPNDLRLKKKMMKEKKKETFDPLSNNFNLYVLDAQLSKIYHWDDEDVRDDGSETMMDRHLRKKKKIIDKLYSEYNPKGTKAAQHPELADLTKDITNTFKRIAFINTVWKAPPKHWLAVFFNAGAYYLMESRFKKVYWKHFDFVNKSGIFISLHIFIKNFWS